jgi:hypothetical protein
MKNPKRITALRPSVQSDRHFTEVLAYGIVFTIKSQAEISSFDLMVNTML